jgi:hypothetical protein
MCFRERITSSAPAGVPVTVTTPDLWRAKEVARRLYQLYVCRLQRKRQDATQRKLDEFHERIKPVRERTNRSGHRCYRLSQATAHIDYRDRMWASYRNHSQFLGARDE